MFISFEGLDGCGKSTHMRFLAEHLQSKGFDVVTTYEPGSTALGKLIREVLLRPEDVAVKLGLESERVELSNLAEAMLYAADRAQHVEELIKPALGKGSIVISDRYVDSSFAYQGYVRGLGFENVKMINETAIGSLYPNLTFFLDMPVEKLRYRMAKREMDRIEKEGMVFYKKVRNAYLDIADKNHSRFVIIDSDRSKETVFADVKKVAEQKLGI